MSVQEQVIEKFKEIRHLAVQNVPQTSDEESELEEVAAALWDDAKKVLDLAKEIESLLGPKYGCVEVGDFENLWWKIGKYFFFVENALYWVSDLFGVHTCKDYGSFNSQTGRLVCSFIWFGWPQRRIVGFIY